MAAAQTQVLPKELRLMAPPTMPQARSYLFRQQATGTTYTEGQTIQINLPRLQRSYLTKDSYLRFKLSFSSVNPANSAALTNMTMLDAVGAYGFIDKIEVFDYLGSTLLESTSGHGQLMSLLMDTSTSVTELSKHWNVNAGTRGGDIAYEPNSASFKAFAAGQDRNVNPQVVRTSICGELFNDNAPAATAVTIEREYAFPLLSFLNLLSTKYAPLHNGYTINITLNKAIRAMGCVVIADPPTKPADAQLPLQSAGGSIGYTISDVYYEAQVLELGPQAEAMLLSSTGGQPLIVPTKAFRNYTAAVPVASSSFRLDLNLNVASLTNILWFMRDSSKIDSWLYPSLTARIRNYLQSWYFQYGSSVLPQTSGIKARNTTTSTAKFVNGSTEAYAELMKARHNYSKDNHHSNIDFYSFNNDVSVPYILPGGTNASTTTYIPSKFACGLDLELVSGKSNDMICGLNTNGMNTSIFATFDSQMVAAASTPLAAQVDAFAEYDAFVNIAPGLATTISF